MDLFSALFAKSLSKGGGGGKPALAPWATGTDDEIVAMVNGYYSGALSIDEIKVAWRIGDRRTINLAAMEATYVGESHRAQMVELQILDFEHDDLTTAIGKKTKALITVDLKNCLRDATVSDTGGSSNTENGYMNLANTNVGGWTSCARRSWCNEVFYNSLPNYIKNNIKAVNKLTSIGDASPTINTDSDYCFLLSEIEIFGRSTYSKAGEGSQYAWFADAKANGYKLPKWNSNSNSVSNYWWERSPYELNSEGFCCFGYNGIASYGYNAYYNDGIAPAFCL